MNRYIAFLDILGFSDLVNREDLASVVNRFENANRFIGWLKRHGNDHTYAKDCAPPHHFSFSDTFVIASYGESPGSFIPFIIDAFQLTQALFAQGLPVRGAITFGEADFVPGTNHLIGKGIIAAHVLERKQEWLGVVVDEGSLPQGVFEVFKHPIFEPLFARWNVPLKNGQTLENALVINWRFNLTIEKGTRSLFRQSDDEGARRKIENTCAFVKHIRDAGRHIGYVTNKAGTPLKISFLDGMTVSAKDPRKGVVHGDDL